MSFATPTDVKDLFRQLDTSVTDGAVTDAKIQKWLDSKTIFVIGKVGTLYETPITAGANPLTAKILAEIEAMLVAGIVDDVLNTYAQADKKPQWEKRGMDLLKQYVPDKDKDGKQAEPTVKFTDATYIGTMTQKQQLKLSSTATPIFTKGGNNW